MPSLTWYTVSQVGSESNVIEIVDASFQVASGDVRRSNHQGVPSTTESYLFTENSIIIPVLTRDYFGKSYRCEAENNNVTQPASTNITIDMRCKHFQHNMLTLITIILTIYMHGMQYYRMF